MWPVELFWIVPGILVLAAGAAWFAWWERRTVEREADAAFADWLADEAPTLPIPVVKP